MLTWWQLFTTPLLHYWLVTGSAEWTGEGGTGGAAVAESALGAGLGLLHGAPRPFLLRFDLPRRCRKKRAVRQTPNSN